MSKHHGAKAGKAAGGKRLETSTKQFWPGWLARLSANHNQTPSWPGSWKVAFNHNQTPSK